MAYSYARRNQLAVERGFTSYSYQRKQFSAARNNAALRHNLGAEIIARKDRQPGQAKFIGGHKLTTTHSSDLVQEWYKASQISDNNERRAALKNFMYYDLGEYLEEMGIETDVEQPWYN
ncbi:MAG: hypothetical protein ACREQ5_27745 [Candidatus Dormibacteria bacterium]